MHEKVCERIMSFTHDLWLERRAGGASSGVRNTRASSGVGDTAILVGDTAMIQPAHHTAWGALEEGVGGGGGGGGGRGGGKRAEDRGGEARKEDGDGGHTVERGAVVVLQESETLEEDLPIVLQERETRVQERDTRLLQERDTLVLQHHLHGEIVVLQQDLHLPFF